eukprot:g34515.t1
MMSRCSADSLRWLGLSLVSFSLQTSEGLWLFWNFVGHETLADVGAAFTCYCTSHLPFGGGLCTLIAGVMLEDTFVPGETGTLGGSGGQGHLRKVFRRHLQRDVVEEM